MQILFVCTGNTCRSPLAEIIARRMLKERQLHGVRVASAGTNASTGAPASDGSLLVALEHGMDLTTHRSQPLTAKLVAASSLILAMGIHNLQCAEMMGGAGKSWLLTAYANENAVADGVVDPFGGDLAGYRATYDQLVAEISRIIDHIAHDQSNPVD